MQDEVAAPTQPMEEVTAQVELRGVGPPEERDEPLTQVVLRERQQVVGRVLSASASSRSFGAAARSTSIAEDA